jgi:hypothetical protein
MARCVHGTGTVTVGLYCTDHITVTAHSPKQEGEMCKGKTWDRAKEPAVNQGNGSMWAVSRGPEGSALATTLQAHEGQWHLK